MFEPSSSARVFALPPGVDFPQSLVQGLLDRFSDRSPEALARVHLVVNTQRMARRVATLLGSAGPRLHPRISLITDVSSLPGARPAPPPASALRRRLQLTQLIQSLLEAQPDLAGQNSAFDLAGSLASLIDEMHGEGVAPAALRELDLGHLSNHWTRAREFIEIADGYLESVETAPDGEARHRGLVECLIDSWQDNPPDAPILVAGSTGSRGTTSLFLQAVARLPQGAVILPGYDFDAPSAVLAQMGDALSGEDHPQYRFQRLLQSLDLDPDHIERWNMAQPPSPDRGKVVSLALRPAPFTDAWLQEGPELPDPRGAMQGVTLVEAESAREEALAIATRLRQAAEDNQTAALITPDRTLARQVSAALDRWDLVADDSAGEPLHLSPPGRFLRQIAAILVKPPRSDGLMALLKHPLTHSGGDRGEHLRLTRNFELFLRDKGIPFPDVAVLSRFGATAEDAENWVNWLTALLRGCDQVSTKPLSEHLNRLLSLSQAFAAGSASADSGALWQHNAGRKAAEVCANLADAADAGGAMSGWEFQTLLSQLLAQEEVRDRDAPDTRIMIWGTLEARVQGADLVVLGGLNEGSWPEAPTADPWLNRELRHKVGLLVPERRIGLAAHDFQQAIGAPEVWLTRTRKSDSAETVPSRWLNRMTNLLEGLADTGGRTALSDMRARGARWLGYARQLDNAPRQAPAPRPSPTPPQGAQLDRISVTGIRTLIRDPYAIYARSVLRLRPLNPLVRPPDALLRGIVVHGVFETFVRDTAAGKVSLSGEQLMKTSREILDASVPWPVARALWLARIESVCDWFVAAETQRRQTALPVGFEQRLTLKLTEPEFTVFGFADRIDRDTDGCLLVYDYKTGKPPTKKEQLHFEKQLLVEAALLVNGAWPPEPAPVVADARYIGLGASPTEVPAPLEDETPQTVIEGLKSLVRAYVVDGYGYTSRRAMQRDAVSGDYDHLARFGEWDHSSAPQRVVLK